MVKRMRCGYLPRRKKMLSSHEDQQNFLDLKQSGRMNSFNKKYLVSYVFYNGIELVKSEKRRNEGQYQRGYLRSEERRRGGNPQAKMQNMDMEELKRYLE